MTTDTPQLEQVDAAKARRSLRNGFITLILGGALIIGLLLAVPGLKGVARTVSHMKVQWVVVAVLLEALSCASYILAFLQVFDRAPFRVGARIALTEEAFGAAVSLGGVGSLAVGGWLMVERGSPPRRIAERSAVLFLYTTAINVITLVMAGLGLFLGLPGPRNPLLSLLPATVGAVGFVLVLLLPRYVDRIVRRLEPGRLHSFLTETANTVRDTKQLVFHPDWRILGAIGYLWFDIAVLFACFGAAGQTPPLAPVVLAYQIAYLSNFIPVPGGIGVLDGSMIGMLVLYGVNGTVAAAATLVYHAISLWVPAVWGTIAFILLQRTRKQPIVLRNPTEELRPRFHEGKPPGRRGRKSPPSGEDSSPVSGQ
ncbi:MAG TPA: lysylphosphatidylglycerol synthase transmembrane domain-containing protein [Solirubrobacteraceae bacterium]|nr:lysylphosphatidylglycerol synthase transmembrane domain-containing protein [Solirubrobacteraceae bacterium]